MAVKTEYITGRSYNAVIGGAVLLGCRLTQTPVLATEIATCISEETGTTITGGAIRNQARQLSRELDVVMPPVSADAFLARFVDECDLTAEQRELCYELLETAGDEITSGIRPSVLAASIIDAVRRLVPMELEQQEIATISNASPEQIREYSTLLSQMAD